MPFGQLRPVRRKNDDRRPSPSSSSLRLVALGGLGEVGMNCMLVETDRDAFVLDCGVTFPEKTFGADISHARFDYLEERRDRIRAIVVTHGHEDHVGAVPYLLRRLDVPVYGPPYALALLEKRLTEVEVPDPVDARPLASGRSFGIGDDFEIEPFAVNHSLPDAHGLVMRTPAGIVVHTGDFKIEADPIEGQRFDRAVLERASREGVRLLLSDSTNIDVEGRAATERECAAALEPMIANARRRVVVSTFASNSFRLQTLVEIAKRTRRKIALLGRSMWTHARIQESLGHLDGLSKLLVPTERMESTPREELLVIATGSQGEAPAALSRLARGTHPDLELDPGDMVILSSRIIPGAEVTVHSLIDALERRGVEVRHRRTDPALHASGHACRGEQTEMIELVRPQIFMPVHGTFHHLKTHAQVARDLGVRETLVVENGAVVELDDAGLSVIGHTPTGRVHCAAGDEIADAVLKDRALIAMHGVVFAAVPISRDLERLSHPRVTSRGLLDPLDADDDELVREAEHHLHRALKAKLRDFERPDEVREAASRALKRFFHDELGRKPLVSVVLVAL